MQDGVLTNMDIAMSQFSKQFFECLFWKYFMLFYSPLVIWSIWWGSFPQLHFSSWLDSLLPMPRLWCGPPPFPQVEVVSACGLGAGEEPASSPVQSDWWIFDTEWVDSFLVKVEHYLAGNIYSGAFWDSFLLALPEVWTYRYVGANCAIKPRKVIWVFFLPFLYRLVYLILYIYILSAVDVVFLYIENIYSLSGFIYRTVLFVDICLLPPVLWDTHAPYRIGEAHFLVETPITPWLYSCFNISPCI